jgi:glyoxylase-like metal-dependent hydrolase (beta-lactamase superfamily II)
MAIGIRVPHEQSGQEVIMFAADRSLLSRRSFVRGAGVAAVTGLAAEILTGRGFAKAPLINTPAPAFYRFKLGAFELTVVSDGPLHMGEPSGNVFVGMSKEQMVKTLADNMLPSDDVLLEQNVLVVNTGDRLILVDTGLGSFKMMGSDSGRLLENLRAAGIDPKDIDAIVLTHAHPDHCWALMADDGTRNFPNAQIHMPQADLDFWTDEAQISNPALGMFIAGARRHLLPNRDRIVFVKDGQEFLPGIQAMSAPGRTVGHTVYTITSQGKTICDAGDIAHHAVLSVENPRREFVYDTDGKQAVASRLRVFDMLASSRTPLIAYHFPWPGIGLLAKQGEGFRYFPAPMRTTL